MVSTDSNSTERPRDLSVLIFTFFWPPIGFLVFLLLVSTNVLIDPAFWTSLVTAPYHESIGLFLSVIGTLISGIPTSYILGVIPAILAGKVTSFIVRTDGRFEIILVALTGLLTGLAYWLFMGVMSGDLISGEWTANGVCNYAITCLVPTIICWILARKARKRTRVTS